MYCKPGTGHRIKDENRPGRINWLHITPKHRPKVRTAHIDLADWLIEYLEDKNA